MVDVLYANFAKEDWIQNVPRGQPGRPQLNREECFGMDNGKSRQDLGLEVGLIGFSLFIVI